MQNKDLIRAEEFCTHYNIQFSFVNSLNQFGLVDLRSIDDTYYIPEDQMQRLEQLIRLHNDLEINLQGIDAISHLLEKVKAMQNEIATLKSKLAVYDLLTQPGEDWM